MPALEAPRFTYAPAEGLRINYAPAYDDNTMMPQLVEGLFVCDAGVARSKDVHPIHSPPRHADRMLEAIYTVLAAKSFTELDPKGSRPFEAGKGVYGFWYYLTSSFKEQLEEVFSSDEETVITAATTCFEAMNMFSPNKTPNNYELEVDKLGDSGYAFRAGSYSLRVSEGTIHNISFDGVAGMNTSAANRTTEGDTIHHYDNDHASQKMGLLLGIGSIAHTVWQHSLENNS